MTLPAEFVVRLNSRTRVIEHGAAMVGGSPTRYIRLSPEAQSVLQGREVDASTAMGANLAEKLLELAMADPVVELLPDLEEPYTIVVPVMNRAAPLDRLLTSVRSSTRRQNPRIIVVDDASEDPTLLHDVAVKHGAEFVPLAVNVGPGGARNAGLALVKTEFVVFLDSDLVINTDTIPLLLRHFSDPKVAMAVPRIVGMPHQRNWIGKYENARSSLDLGPIRGVVKPRSPLSWAPSAGVVARVSAITDGFDPSMRVGEDVDLVWRLSESGWRVRYEPTATAQHEHRDHFREWFKRKAQYGTGAVPLAKKHPGSIAPAVMTPWSVALMVALIAQRRWSLPVAILIALGASARNSRLLASAHNPSGLAAELTAQGIVSAGAQTSALMLKHWWPLTLVGAVFSKRIRRAVFIAAVVDIAVEYDKEDYELDVVRFGVARRLDDVAYGSGVWLASLKGWTIAALKPDWRMKK